MLALDLSTHSGWHVNLTARLLDQSPVRAYTVRVEEKGRLAQCGGRFRCSADRGQCARVPKQGNSSVTLLRRNPPPEDRGFVRGRNRVVTATEPALRACYVDCDVSNVW